MPLAKGFTLGKFAPLHKGHELLIDTALLHVQHLIVVVYECDELPHCSLQTRINWIQQLYPQVQVIAATDGPKEVGYSQDITQKHDAYLLSLLKGHKFDAFFSSEPYGKHVSKAFGCLDVRVDQSRGKIPISATNIRQDVRIHAQFLSRVVLNDVIKLDK